MTEYAGFHRPGEVTLLLEPVHAGSVAGITPADLAEMHETVRRAGVELHKVQGRGHAGRRVPVVVSHCHDTPHVLHTINLKGWTSPEEQARSDTRRARDERRRREGNILRRAAFSAGYGARGLVGALRRRDRGHAVRRSLSATLDAVAKLNHPSRAGLRSDKFRLLAATPNWLASPAQIT